jgi:hypothetical protein
MNMGVYKFFFTFAACLLFMQVSAKERKQPGKWYCDFKKIEGSEYEIVFHLNLDEGWYVSAEENEDKGLLPPTFQFDKPEGRFTFSGELLPKGIMETKNIKRKGLVNIYSFNALYTQRVFARPNTRITGTFKYQFFSASKVRRVVSDKFDVTVK